MILKDLCAAAGIVCPTAGEDTEIGAIVSHSAAVVPGCLFVCLRGTRTDGHQYAAEAAAGGAVAILCEGDATPEVGEGVILLHSDNTRRALAFLYDAWYGYPSRHLRLIAVTGTNGKTSVTFMIKRILEAAMLRCGLIGTVRCYCGDRVLKSQSDNELANMTTPDPRELYRLLGEMARAGVDYVVMETTSHALALSKLAPLRFEVAVFTNLTPEHLDFHGDMNAYFEAKRSLFAMCQHAVINVDDPYGRALADGCECAVTTCAVEAPAADCRGGRVHDGGSEGVEYTLYSKNNVFRVRCRIPGRFSLYNSLQAAATALVLGVPANIIQSAIGALDGIDGRMERVRLGVLTDFSVFVDYAHTPDALENLLRTARGFASPGQRIVLLFGCGGDRDRSKRREMGRLASRLADFVIVTSDNSRGEEPMTIMLDILRGMDKEKPYAVIPSRREAIEYAVREARRGDVILLAGKGHETYEIDRHGRRPFDEKKIAAEAARAYYKTKDGEREP